jgi:hypothetical protein
MNNAEITELGNYIIGIITSSDILNTIMVFPLIYLLGGTGVCWSMLVTKTYVTTTMGWTLHKRGILI